MTALNVPFCLFVCFVFWPGGQHVEVPGPGIQPLPQQWPELLRRQRQILNLLHHKRTLKRCLFDVIILSQRQLRSSKCRKSSLPTSSSAYRQDINSPLLDSRFLSSLKKSAKHLTQLGSSHIFTFPLFLKSFPLSCVFVFLGPYPRHMEVPRLGV